MELRKYELVVLSKKQEISFIRFLKGINCEYSFSDKRRDGRYNYIHIKASDLDHALILARKAFVRSRIL